MASKKVLILYYSGSGRLLVEKGILTKEEFWRWRRWWRSGDEEEGQEQRDKSG